MNELIERLIDWASNLPVGLIVFIIAIAFSFFGKDEKKQQQQQQRREETSRIPEGDDVPGPIAPADAYAREERPAAAGGHVFASDQRREREERARQQEEVIVFGGLDFGRPGSLFDDERDDRDSRWGESQWGKTKYGFEEAEWGSEWGSGYSDKKNPDPIIR